MCCTRQAMHVSLIIEARSFKEFCRGKAVVRSQGVCL